MVEDLRLGAVIIGRNEGQRLVDCLASVLGQVDHVVYVDSGSTDQSVANARAAGVDVISLDLSIPFTAARARNAGVSALVAAQPDTSYVQFIDGDCSLQPGWIRTAARYLDQAADVAVVCGRRRERYPDASIYNRLCDREWDTPPGAAKACGGDALMRLDALCKVGGFDPQLIAGEEPELCVRLRHAGWTIWRLDAEMTLHDAAMSRFGQWWRRTARGGHAAAEGMALHGVGSDRHGVRATLRAVAWGLGLPFVAMACAVTSGPWAFALLLAYPANVVRIAARLGPVARENWEQALFLGIAKFPETAGVLGYWSGRLLRRPASLIEYK